MQMFSFYLFICLIVHIGNCRISGEFCIENDNCTSCNDSYPKDNTSRWIRWHCGQGYKVAVVIQVVNETKECYEAHNEFFPTNVDLDFDDVSFTLTCNAQGEYPLLVPGRNGFTCVNSSNLDPSKSVPVIILACTENNYEEKWPEAHSYEFISLLVVPVVIISVVAMAYRRRKQQLKLSNLQQRASNNTYEEFPENLPEHLTDKESIQGIENKLTGVENEHIDLKHEACGDSHKSLTASVDEMTDDKKSAHNVCTDLISADQICDDYATIEKVADSMMTTNTFSVEMKTADKISADKACDDSKFGDNVDTDYATIDKISAKEMPTNTFSVEIRTTGRISAESMEVEITAEKNCYAHVKSRPSTKTNTYSYVRRNLSTEVENNPENGDKKNEKDDVDVYDVLKFKS